MFKYRTHQNVSSIPSVIDEISQVQSNLAHSVREIIHRANMGFPIQGHSVLDNEIIPSQYLNMSFTELHEKYIQLSNWYESNKTEIENVLNNSNSSPIEQKTEMSE